MKAFLLLSLFVVLATSGLAQSEAADRFIEVTGTATVTTPVDILEWAVGIRSVSETLAESAKSTEEAFARLKEKLAALDIDGLELFSTDMVSGREYSQEDGHRHPGRPIGYFTERRVRATLPKSARSREVEAILLSEEVFAIRDYSGKSSKEQEIKQQALRDAAAVAREKAVLLAGALGAKPGEVVRIVEGSTSNLIVSSNVIDRSAFSTGNFGELRDVSISQTVTVRFALAD